MRNFQIWKNGVRVQNINLTKLNKHGKIYENSGINKISLYYKSSIRCYGH